MINYKYISLIKLIEIKILIIILGVHFNAFLDKRS